MVILVIVVFILILGVLIFVHELGHFLAAKRFGAKVEEFGFGFPPRIFGIKRGETTYSLNLIPLGGFVKIYGESGEDPDNDRSFASKPAWQRAIILAAGIFMNFLFAFILLIIGFMIGLPTVAEDVDPDLAHKLRDVQVQVIQVVQDSPAEEAGVGIGDQIIRINGEEVGEVVEVQEIIASNEGGEVTLDLERGSEKITTTVPVRTDPPEGEGATGISLLKTGIVSYPFFTAVWKAIIAVGFITAQIFLIVVELIKNLFGAGDTRVIESIAGPVGIAVLTGTMTKLGFAYVLQFTAFISINLGLINALPFPALDGGRLVFLAFEKITGRKPNQRVEQIIHLIGFLLLILLLILVTFRDVFRFQDAIRGFFDAIIDLFRT
jgi:regulator of sigma E protease